MTEHMLYWKFKTVALPFGFIGQTFVMLVLVTANICGKGVTEDSD